MNFRFSFRYFQWKVLLLVVLAMMAILAVSFYVNYRITEVLNEDRLFNGAVRQTVLIANRVITHDYFEAQSELQKDIQLVATTHSDFKQIDVYKLTPNGVERIATTAPDAPALEVLTENSKDNELQEMDKSIPGVVSREDLINDRLHWLITAKIKDQNGDGIEDGYVSALVVKNTYGEFFKGLSRWHKIIIAGTVITSVLLLYLVFAVLFRRPARDIVSAMAAARDGNLEARARVRRDDELGEIAEGFNRLMDELAARAREREELLMQIRNFNDELRREVEAATRELRNSNEILFHTQQRLARSERLAAVGQLAASLAHEIGTPLNAISGHIQLLARNHPKDEDTQRRVRIVSKQLEFIVGIVKSLLERTHWRKPVARPMDLNALVDELLRLVRPTLDTQKIETVTRLDANLPRVRADRDSLHQVLLNLVNNSIDAMPDGGAIVIETRVDAEDRAAELIFRDTGVGIPPHALEHLFEPMWTTKATGSGFGLAIAREIMHEHGGTIEVLTGGERERRGAAFRLTLPLADALALADKTKATAKEARASSRVTAVPRREEVVKTDAA
jgi:two-component system NtrC family sensor kinase